MYSKDNMTLAEISRICTVTYAKSLRACAISQGRLVETFLETRDLALLLEEEEVAFTDEIRRDDYLSRYDNRIQNIFLKMFSSPSNTVIKFLSNKSNFIEDLSVILKMPKWTFIKALFKS